MSLSARRLTPARLARMKPSWLPDSLQTETHARVVDQTAEPKRDPRERLAAARASTSTLHSENAPLIWAILNEVGIRRQVGGKESTGQQLKLGADPNITIQVLLFSPGAHPAMGSGLVHLRPADLLDAEFTYLEGMASTGYLSNPTQIQAASVRHAGSGGAQPRHLSHLDQKRRIRVRVSERNHAQPVTSAGPVTIPVVEVTPGSGALTRTRHCGWRTLRNVPVRSHDNPSTQGGHPSSCDACGFATGIIPARDDTHPQLAPRPRRGASCGCGSDRRGKMGQGYQRLGSFINVRGLGE